MRFNPARWLVGFAALAYAVTVLATAFANYRTLYLNGDNPDFALMLLWQGVTYAIWIPIGMWLWRLFRRDGLDPRAVAKYAVLGAVAIPLHAIFTTAFDTHAASPGTIDLRSLAAQRAQLDILMYGSFAVLALAAHFQRRAAQEAAAAEELRWALQVARLAVERAPATAHDTGEPLMVSAGSRRIPVNTSDVEFFGSAANYVVVNWEGREGLIRETLQGLERRLDPQLFARVHRGTIANLGKVRAAEALADGSWRLLMASGAELVVSRTYRDAILARLGHRGRSRQS